MGMAHGTRRQLNLRVRSPQPRCGSRGFTLTEILVAVAILILLAAIALPFWSARPWPPRWCMKGRTSSNIWMVR